LLFFAHFRSSNKSRYNAELGEAPAIVRKDACGGLEDRRWGEAQLAQFAACRERRSSAAANSCRLKSYVRLRIQFLTNSGFTVAS